jgi:hypothetical protein
MGLPGPFVASLKATRDGGAWVASQAGGLYRLSGRGQATTWSPVGGNTSQLITDDADRLVAVAHSGGAALARGDGKLIQVRDLSGWQRLVRSPDGNMTIAIEGKSLRLLDRNGELMSVVEFSRSVSEAAFIGSKVVVAAGKLVSFEAAMERGA